MARFSAEVEDEVSVSAAFKIWTGFASMQRSLLVVFMRVCVTMRYFAWLTGMDSYCQVVEWTECGCGYPTSYLLREERWAFFNV